MSIRVIGTGACLMALVAVMTISAPKTVLADEEKSSVCVINIDNEGDGFKICDDGVTIGGKIKDVDWEHPVGKGKAFVPQAGRDAEAVLHHAGKNLQNGAQWVGKRLGIRF